MKHCNKCGSKLTEDDLFCPGCGLSIRHEKKQEKSEERYKESKNLIWISIIIILVIAILVGSFFIYKQFHKKNQVIQPYCGDNICNGDEGCLTCSKDCGKCPLGNYCKSNEDCNSGQCKADKCTNCEDKCNQPDFGPYSKCTGDGFYYCSDENNDGCYELVQIYQFSSGFYCSDSMTAKSDTNNMLYESRFKGSLQSKGIMPESIVIGTRYEYGRSVNHVLIVYNCETIAIGGNYLVATCLP